MKKTSWYNILLLTSLVLLFVLACFSIVWIAMKNDLSDISGTIFPIIYLALQMIIIAFAFGMTISSIKKKKSQIVGPMMLQNNVAINKSTMIGFSICSVIGLAAAIYFTLVACKVAPMSSIISNGLVFDILNAGYLLAVGGIFFIIYPFFIERK